VGCELASEIAQHSYPAPYNSKKKITLVESHPKLLKNSSSKRQAKAFDFLSSIGVDIVLDEKIIDFNMSDTNKYVGSSGQSYSNYDKVFLATGTKPCSDIIKGEGDAGFESCLDYGDRIRVKPTLQLDHWKYNHIFAGGDVTNVVEEKTGYAATLAGVCISRNICRLEKRKAPLKQGTKGTLPAPSKPLDGIESHGGLGRRKWLVLVLYKKRRKEGKINAIYLNYFLLIIHLS
jgi:NADH dehydrogenase FAD-containing subunit